MKEPVNGNGSYPASHNGRHNGGHNGRHNGHHPDSHLVSHSNSHFDSHFDSHPDRRMMVDYVAGICSFEERSVIEGHCISCPICWTQLSTLLHMIVSSTNDLEEHDLETLLPLGERAAARARKIIREQEKWDRRGAFSWTSLGKRLQFVRPILAPAFVIFALLGGGLIAYLSLWSQFSEERTLSRVRGIYQDTRLLQARVTGGFAHQQYVATRGPGDLPGVDESKRVALLSELNQEANAHQRAAARHNLGRLFMLRGELAPAEQQFLLALKERPQDARLMADLGALYYERSLKEEDENRELLAKAIEHISNAVETDPRLPEAWFNRALCYERMNLFLQAESDWKQYLTLDSDSAWAEEAREHLDKLHERSTRLKKLDQTVQADFRTAETAGDEIKMRELVAEHFVPVQNLVMDQFFDLYLSAAIAGE